MFSFNSLMPPFDITLLSPHLHRFQRYFDVVPFWCSPHLLRPYSSSYASPFVLRRQLYSSSSLIVLRPHLPYTVGCLPSNSFSSAIILFAFSPHRMRSEGRNKIYIDTAVNINWEHVARSDSERQVALTIPFLK